MKYLFAKDSYWFFVLPPGEKGLSPFVLFLATTSALCPVGKNDCCPFPWLGASCPFSLDPKRNASSHVQRWFQYFSWPPWKGVCEKLQLLLYNSSLGFLCFHWPTVSICQFVNKFHRCLFIMHISWALTPRSIGGQDQGFKTSRRADLLEKTDAGTEWRQEEKGITEDKVAGCHHRLNGHAFKQTPGESEGQGSVACGILWGRRVRHNFE